MTVLVLALYLLPIAGRPPTRNPNEVVRIEAAVAMGEFASVTIDPVIADYGLSEDVSLRKGHLYSDKAPGLSLLAVPLFWIGSAVLEPATDHGLPAYWTLRHLMTAVLVALPTALLPFLLLCRASSVPDHLRAPLATVLALSTPLWTYGTVFFGHAPAAVLIGVAWWLLCGDDGDVSVGRIRTSFWGGVAAGFAVATEYPTVLLVAVMALGFLLRRPARRELVAAGSGGFVGVLPALIYHQLAFGAPWITGYSYKADPGFAAIIDTGVHGVAWPTLHGLWGVLLSPSRGLFAYAPILALGIAGLTVAAIRGSLSARLKLAAFVLYTCFAAGFVDWQAGWGAAARHLTPVVALLIVPTARSIASLAGARSGRAIVAVVATISVANAVLSIVVTPFFPGEFAVPFASFVLPSLADGHTAPTLIAGACGIASAVVWGLVGLVSVTCVILVFASDGRRMKLPVSIAMAAYLTILVAASAARPAELEPMRRWLLGRLGHEVGVTPGAPLQSSPDATDPRASSRVPSTFSRRSRSASRWDSSSVTRSACSPPDSSCCSSSATRAASSSARRFTF
jgi:hypothetical protein